MPSADTRSTVVTDNNDAGRVASTDSSTRLSSVLLDVNSPSSGCKEEQAGFQAWPFVEADLRTLSSKTFVSRAHEQNTYNRHMDCVRDILAPLKYMPKINTLLGEFLANRKFIHTPNRIVRYLLDHIPVAGDGVQASFPGGLEQFAQAVLLASSRPAEVTPDMDMESFCNMFSGPNLRIETVGLIYCLTAKAALYDHRLDEAESGEFVSEMLYFCKLSLRLARTLAPQANDLILWLAYMNVLLMNFVEGDASLEVWHRMTALATDIQSLKIHREYTHARDRTPIFISQNRKRLFATFNYLDKKYATVFDRPPSIRLQYADCQLPLDISEDALFSDHVFQQECAKLTEDGWNIQGGGNGPSSPRARFLLCRILEDILDLRLSLPAQRDERKLKDISTRVRDTWDRLPEHIKYSEDCWAEAGPQGCLHIACIYLAYLHADFSIFHLLKRDGNTPVELITLSWKLLDVVLQLSKRRNSGVMHSEDLPAILLGYGVPSAIVLLDALMEIDSGPSQLPSPLQRASVLRGLSVLAVQLEMASDKSEPNHLFCEHAAKIVSGKLDRVLDPQSRKPVEEPLTSLTAVNQLAGSNMHNFGTSPLMFTEYAALAEQGWVNWALIDPEYSMTMPQSFT